MTETPEEPQTTMAELFARDPMNLSRIDKDRMIETLRKQRKQFVSGFKSAGTPASRKSKNTVAQEKALEAAKGVDLDDLLGGL